MTVALEGRAVGAAPAAWLAAHWWSRPVREELDAWERAWPDARAVAAALGVEIDDLEAGARAPDEEALLEEYERLFVGPGRAPCPPYEALWLSDRPRRERGTLMGTATTEVQRLYRELRLSVRSAAHELPDHVAIEWEALAYALELPAAEVARALLEDHLAVWMPGFCVAVERESGHAFYRALARLTPSWIAGLSEP